MNAHREVPYPAPSPWIDGRAVEGSGPLIDVVNPADESVIASVHEGTAEDVDHAVDAALAAFPAWSSTSPEDHIAVVRRLADGMQKHSEELAATITLEMGPRSASRGRRRPDSPWRRHSPRSLRLRSTSGRR